MVFSDDYGRVASEKVDSCPLLLPPLCVQVRDLEKALIERTREWSERKLGMETEVGEEAAEVDDGRMYGQVYLDSLWI